MKLDSLVHIIQSAALSANEALHERNTSLIDLYFDKVEESAKSKIRKSFSEDGDLDEKQLEDIISELSPDILKIIQGSEGKLVPKMVTIQYPRETADGPVAHDVLVPLITLVPLSLTEISSVKFKTDLEIQLIDEKLDISFPNKTNRKNTDVAIANLEINIDKSQPPEGLRRLIEGYERSLRAQIPG